MKALGALQQAARPAWTSSNQPEEQVNVMIETPVYQAVGRLLIHAAGVVPDPAPVAPNGSNALVTLLSWVKWGALVCCAGAAVTAGAMIALGNTSRRAEMAERGKVTLICSVLGAVVIAVAGTLITSSYGLG